MRNTLAVRRWRVAGRQTSSWCQRAFCSAAAKFAQRFLLACSPCCNWPCWLLPIWMVDMVYTAAATAQVTNS
jgi:hypothetical protein